MKEAIQCKYSCRKCGTVKRVVTVPARQEEDVITWVMETAKLLSADHDRHSPLCQITKLDEVWIPIENGDDAKIGGPVKPTEPRTI